MDATRRWRTCERRRGQMRARRDVEGLGWQVPSLHASFFRSTHGGRLLDSEGLRIRTPPWRMSHERECSTAHVLTGTRLPGGGFLGIRWPIPGPRLKREHPSGVGMASIRRRVPVATTIRAHGIVPWASRDPGLWEGFRGRCDVGFSMVRSDPDP
jgi:hypothetical protein